MRATIVLVLALIGNAMPMPVQNFGMGGLAQRAVARPNERAAPIQQPLGLAPLSQREIDDLLRQWKEGTISPDEVMNVFRSRRDQGRELQELDASEALRGPAAQVDRYGPRPPPRVIPPENQRHPFKRNIWDY
jgi:hypothetical protein